MKEEEDKIPSGGESTGGQSEGKELSLLEGKPLSEKQLDHAKKISAQQIHTLSHPKKLTYEGSRLKSSEPPMTPEKLAPKVREHKELIDYMAKKGDLPIGWPICGYDDTRFSSQVLGRTGSSWIHPEGPCPEPAAWIVQLDYYDPKSDKAYICTRHFMLLPVQPVGSMYRVFRLTMNNYRRELDEMASKAPKEEEES